MDLHTDPDPHFGPPTHAKHNTPHPPEVTKRSKQAWATGRKSSNIAGEILPRDACDAPRTVGTGE